MRVLRFERNISINPSYHDERMLMKHNVDWVTIARAEIVGEYGNDGKSGCPKIDLDCFSEFWI